MCYVTWEVHDNHHFIAENVWNWFEKQNKFLNGDLNKRYFVWIMFKILQLNKMKKFSMTTISIFKRQVHEAFIMTESLTIPWAVALVLITNVTIQTQAYI